ncbi:hypothetical protein SDRG_09446 [Saprolegnia diclina VS20]|uniref:Myosin motor domain-containing protein n=1 Tax=Saprolegnia diclina (strain VS20) TaxID=1156394 RepID=T0QH06_SAPDV|nr:hypothetical protein SDRG_09446 [Saprolegnia diclina VS20]EQC32915.1 hypothetical protein SDRG_09446 [Saprolegnia diclina VS20]|eukprot:XP_008613601.1 hypothetical protein SDRG_09446 [Saprolegnia diclina VS20]
MTSTFGDQSMGSLVWVPHEKEVWKKAQAIEKPTETTVTVRLLADGDGYDPEDGVVKTFEIAEIAKLAGEVSSTAMPICNTFEKLGVEDMCTLNHLHEPAVLKNLQLRHAQSIPYTYTGQICIAVNPYKWLDLYGKDLYRKYLDQPRSDLTPHPFALSASAYLDMRKLRIEQSILVSGESGAGKTETVKIMMHHLASVSGGGEKGSTVIDQVLKSNPLLEAFGNAKTKRNDNSSRFGKFAQLQFDASGYLIGARCETYLLEKSRVVGQTEGERNYHIFYQVFSLASELKKTLFLEGNVADYNFVKVGAGSRVDNTDDSVFLQETKDAMDTIGIDDREQHGIFEIVSAILNLGEVAFTAVNAESSQVSTSENLAAVAALLKTAPEALTKTLCQRTMTTRGETFTIPLKVDQAFDLRDAFAKGIYSRLFDWLVGGINRAICSTKNVSSHIGLLDIFGFESFDHNGFEQLCINYANEKLQQKFNSDIFKTVQAEYIEEGIPLDLVRFEDNQPILDLIEGKLGIVDMLNETGLQPKGDDRMFVNKVNESFADHKNYEKIRTNPMQFKILHYAGDVTYDGTKFLDKNKDTLPADLMELLASSQSSFIRDVFPELAKGGVSKDKNAKPPSRRQGFLVGNTIAGSFRKQLGELMDQIAKTSTQYVRCIKPNANKSATEFDRHMVVDQLRCAGVIAAIRISRAAFPNRLSLKEFTSRFAIICPSKLRSAPPEAMVHGLLEILGISESSSRNARFAIGRTKVYFSSGLFHHLEDQRAVVLRQYATRIQAYMRGYVLRKRFLATRQSALVVQTAVRRFTAQKAYRSMKSGTIRLQTRVRGMQARKRFVVIVEAERARKAAEHERQVAFQKAKAAAEAAEAKAQAAHKATRATEIKIMEEDKTRTSSNVDDEPVDTSSDDGDRLSASSQSILTSAAARVAEAEAAAVEAQKAAMAALTHNRVIQAENESLRAKMAAYVAEHADAELLRENERLKHQVLTLQSKLVRAQEVSLISAKVVDSRITFREGRQFVEYKLQIETNSRGTLFVWHRYSTFRNLATTLQTKNGYRRKDIPDLPNKQLFGNFTDRIIQERIQKLNEFLEAATNTDYLQWGIRVDQDTCVYKRRTRSSSGADRESIAIGRESMALTHNSSMASEDTSRESVSRESFSIRESLSSKFSLRRSKN